MRVYVSENKLVIELGDEKSPAEFVNVFNAIWSPRIPIEWGTFLARERNDQVQIGRKAGSYTSRFNWCTFWGRREFRPPYQKKDPVVSACDEAPLGRQFRKRNSYARR